MPWTLSDPPPGTADLPVGARRIFIRVANAVLAETSDDEQAMMAGWSAVKQHYVKGDDGKWRRKPVSADANPAWAQAVITLEAEDAPAELLHEALDVLVSVSAQEGMGRNRGDAPGSGPGGQCVCPSCGYTTPHETNRPCNEIECPECGATMTRQTADVEATPQVPAATATFEAGWGGLSEEQVRQGIRNLLSTDESPYVYVRELYPDSVIVEVAEDFFRYDLDVKDNDLKLTNKRQVRLAYAPVSAAASEQNAAEFWADWRGLSAEEVKRLVRIAIRSGLQAAPYGDMNESPWIREFYEDAVIVEVGDVFYRVPYEVNEQEEIDLGIAIEVKPRWVEASADADGEGIEAAILSSKQRKALPKGSFIFPADDDRVTDGAGHFPVPDLAHARNALARVAQYRAAPSWWNGTLEELQNAVRTHVYKRYPALKKDKEQTASVYDLLPEGMAEIEPEELPRCLAASVDASVDYDQVAAIVAAVPQFDGVIDPVDLAQLEGHAQGRAEELAADGRELCIMPFLAGGEQFKWEDHGDRISFEVVVGQVDTPLIPRTALDPDKVLPVVFPSDEIKANLPRLEREIALGRVFGEADHPPDGKPRIRETCVVYDKFYLDGNDIVALGRTTTNQAGQDIRQLVLDGINIEWSLRGWGKPEKGEWNGDDQYKGREVLYARNFLLNTFDVVTKGLASTGFRRIAADDAGGVEMSEEAKMDKEEPGVAPTSGPEEPTQMTPDPTPDPTPEPIPPAPAPVRASADVPTLASQGDMQAAVQDAVDKALAAQETARAIQAEVDRVLASADLDEAARGLMRVHFEGADSIEAVHAIQASLEPLLSRLTQPDHAPGGNGVLGVMPGVGPMEKSVVTHMIAGDGTVIERPRRIEGVIEALCAGLRDTGRADWDNPTYQFRQILANYVGPQAGPFAAPLLNSMTRDGARAFYATAQTTAVMGLQTPAVLPMLRLLYPKLIYTEIASIQPMSQPSGRVYWMDVVKQDTGDSTADGSNFDRYWADRSTEATEKQQLGIELSYDDISAKEKSIYYSLSHELIQDLAAVHGVNGQQELLAESVNEIAREINYEVIFDMLNLATGGAADFGTAAPTTGNWQQGDWYNEVVTYVGIIAAQIRAANAGRGPNFLIADPMSARLLQHVNDWRAYPDATEDMFGLGLKLDGTIGTTWKVYQADWLTPNRIIVGYKGDSWRWAGYIYAPYIPLYISPEDYTASTNVSEQSVTSRYARYFPRPDLFGVLTVLPGTAGVAPFMS